MFRYLHLTSHLLLELKSHIGIPPSLIWLAVSSILTLTSTVKRHSYITSMVHGYSPALHTQSDWCEHLRRLWIAWGPSLTIAILFWSQAGVVDITVKRKKKKTRDYLEMHMISPGSSIGWLARVGCRLYCTILWGKKVSFSFGGHWKSVYSEAIDSNIYITSICSYICILAVLLVSCGCRLISSMAFTAWVIAAQFSRIWHPWAKTGSAPLRKCGNINRFPHVT